MQLPRSAWLGSLALLSNLVLLSGCGGNPEVISGDGSGAQSSPDAGGNGVASRPDQDPDPTGGFSLNDGDAGSRGDIPEDCDAGDCAMFEAVEGPVCGDGELDEDEDCDDGNGLPGDGCSGTCSVEANFTCPTPGKACESSISCGDGELAPTETCDDGNDESGDGCNGDCTAIERNFVCPEVGEDCLSTVVCGDGRVSDGEECDDENSDDGDGCDSSCLVEDGYVCPRAGEDCVKPDVCGDGSVTGRETCDDGNTDSGDGCSENCFVEAFFECPDPGDDCVSTLVCGDGMARGSESCDDTNMDSGDGCSSSCELESGWTCPVPGLPCFSAACGDGVLAGTEECEYAEPTTEPMDGEGCSAQCTIEDGYDCDPMTMSCSETLCGNSETERGEQCDDGNLTPFDGCHQCLLDPACVRGSCQSQCGDAQRFADEDCDDGNTRDGDGCSQACKIEMGFVCDDVLDDPPEELALPVIFRDFVGRGNQLDGATYHEDFNQLNGNGVLGIVDTELGDDGRPVFACPGGDCEQNPGHLFQAGADDRPNMSTPENFAQWYANTPDINLEIPATLPLTRDGADGSYHFDSDNAGAFFDPLHAEGWIAQGKERLVCDPTRNVSFTSETHFWFEYEGGERFDFSGDDDVWVFVNNRLTIDLGGLHVRLDAYFQLDSDTDGAGADIADGTAYIQSDLEPAGRTVDLGLEVGSAYEVVMFHAERNQCGSNFNITLKDFNKPRSSCHSVCGDGVIARDEICDEGPSTGDGPDVDPLNNSGEYNHCGPDCRSRGEFCGDAEVQADHGEICDDGLNTGRYGQCAPGCVQGPFCGDGELDPIFEECDEGDDNDDSGAYGGCTVQCERGPFCGDGSVQEDEGEVCDDGVNDARYDGCAAGCVPGPRCGDGIIQESEGEKCDDGDEQNTGEYGKCKSNCRLGPRCGDGIKQAEETCDDGVNDGSYGTCTTTCSIGPYCGDAVVQPEAGEQCDDGVNDGGYGECAKGCKIGPVCGDGKVQGPEECDDGNRKDLDGCSAGCKKEKIILQ